MKKAERESFLKSFTVFFTSLSFLLSALFYVEYKKLEHKELDDIYGRMKLCSYDLKCKEFDFDFEALERKELFLLHKNETQLYALFPIPKNDRYALKLSFEIEKYEERLNDLRITLALYFCLSLLFVATLSALFSIFALKPLRSALNLTEEFAKDILHDLNTPLAALRVDVSRLKVDDGERRKIERINRSISAIVSLGENLRSYLLQHENINEEVDILSVVSESIERYEKLYPNLAYTIEGDGFKLFTNKSALQRVVDNLISNASKYNDRGQSVSVELLCDKKCLIVADDGNGIEHPELIFERHYSEGRRGLGLGLHIVKKFCDEMGARISVDSKVGKGSRFTLCFGRMR